MKKIILLTIFIVMFTYTNSWATSIRVMPLEELVIQSELIVLASFKQKEEMGKVGDYGLTEIKNTIEIIEVYKGDVAAGDLIEVITLDGIVGGITFHQDYDFIVFLAAESECGSISVVNFNQGYWPLSSSDEILGMHSNTSIDELKEVVASTAGVPIIPESLNISSTEARMDDAELALRELAVQGKLTVRALRAWDRLPERFMHMALELRQQGSDILSADQEGIEKLAAEARASDGEPLQNHADVLEELAAYMDSFMSIDMDEDVAETVLVQTDNDFEAIAALPLIEQQALAHELFNRIGALEDWELEEMEKLYLQLMEEAPDTVQAQESYWRLSNMYMRGFSPARNLEAIALLERYLERYPESTLLDERFAMFATPGMPLVEKRLLFLYEDEEKWEKAVALYERLIPDPAQADQGVLDHFIAYGRVLEEVGRRDDAAQVYLAYLNQAEKTSEILERSASSRLSALGAEVPDPPVKTSLDSLLDAAEAGNLEEVKRLVAEGADIEERQTEWGHQDNSLQIAVVNGHIEIAKYLLSQGADPNSTGRVTWRYPIMLAVENDDVAMARTLIEAGADVHAQGRGKSTALHLAALSGNEELANLLLEKGAFIDAETSSRQRPLHYTASGDQKDLAQLLISSGAEIDAKDNRGQTPLHLAVINKHRDLAELLIFSGADVNAVTDIGRTPLHLATQLEQDADTWVDMLLAAGADAAIAEERGVFPFDLAVQAGSADIARKLFAEEVDLELDPGRGLRRLHRAAAGGQEAMIELFLDLGADVNAQNHNQETPLHLAVYQGSTEVVSKLLAAGADPNLTDQQGTAPMHVAIDRHNLPLFQLLVDHGSDPNLPYRRDLPALLQVIDSAQAEPETALTMASALLEAGADLSVQDRQGRTPVQAAVSYGLNDFVVLLDAHGADLSIKDRHDRGLLHTAISRGHPDVVEYLLSKGANAKEADRRGSTLLHLAAKENQVQIAAHLLNHGADLQALDDRGRSALHEAASSGNVEMIEWLLEQGLDVAARDSDGKTPVELAFERNQSEVVAMLTEGGATIFDDLLEAAGSGEAEDVQRHLERGADLSAVDEVGNTALHLASAGGYLDVAEILIEAGIDVNARNQWQATPLHYAAGFGHHDLVKFLVSRGADENVLELSHALDSEGNTALHYAVELEEIDSAAYLLRQGTDVNAANELGETALVWAIMETFRYWNAYQDMPAWFEEKEALTSRLELLSTLLAHGAEVNVHDRDYQLTPLHAAALMGDQRLVDALLEREADIEARDHNGFTPVHLAISEGHLELAEHLLDSGAKLDLQEKGGPLLVKAAETGKLAGMKFLLTHGVDVNSLDQEGTSALHLAVMTRNIQAVDFLLAQGADANIRDAENITPLLLVAGNESREEQLHIAESLIAHGAEADFESLEWPLLRIAALKNDLSLVKSLLEQEESVEPGEEKGWAWSILHGAARTGHAEIVNLLMEHGADPETKSRGRETPIVFAALAGHGDVVELLLQKGADVEPLYQILSRAISHRPDMETIATLVSVGVDLNAEVGWHGPALFHAEDPEMIEYLISLGADVNQMSNRGTVLSRAASDGDAPLVALLLSHGADPELADEQWGRTPLHKAIAEEHEDVAVMLIEHGADIQARDNRQRTPLHLAAQAGSLALVSMLIEHGADVDSRNDSDHTPMDLARRAQHADVLRLLKASLPSADLVWKFQAGAPIFSSPAVAGGMVFVGVVDGRLVAVDQASGLEKWSFQAEGDITSTPTVQGGLVYVGSADHRLYALDMLTGQQSWVFETGEEIVSSPTVVDGTVYFGSFDQHLYALDASSGEKKWRFKAEEAIFSSPGVSGGLVFFGCLDGSLYALDQENGKKKWKFETGGEVTSSPLVADGIVYFGSYDGSLYALDQNSGQKIWKFDTWYSVFASPFVTGNQVFIVSASGILFAVDQETGQVIWNFRTQGGTMASPFAVAGVVYQGSNDTHLYALDQATGQEIWRFKTGDVIVSSAMVMDDAIYFGSFDGYLYAVKHPDEVRSAGF